MPRRSRRRIVGKWEQVEREEREEELKDLEDELHGRRRRRRRKRKQTGAPERQTPQGGSTDSDG